MSGSGSGGPHEPRRGGSGEAEGPEHRHELGGPDAPRVLGEGGAELGPGYGGGPEGASAEGLGEPGGPTGAHGGPEAEAQGSGGPAQHAPDARGAGDDPRGGAATDAHGVVRGGAGRDGAGRGGRRGRTRVRGSMVPEAEFVSYYGRPILKRPTWKNPDVPLYLWVGGMAGTSAVLAALGGETARPALQRHGRLLAAGGALAGTVALVHDLGRPERFHHMLRVVKPTSPLSVGTWILSPFAAFASAAAASELTGIAPRLGRLAGWGAAAFGPPLATYTAVLLADTAVPAWHEAHRELPVVFAGSAAAAGGGAMLALGGLTGRTGGLGPARRAGVVGAAVELAVEAMMRKRLSRLPGEIDRAFTTGRPGRWHVASEVLTAVGALGALASQPAARRAATGVLGALGAFGAGVLGAGPALRGGRGRAAGGVLGRTGTGLGGARGRVGIGLGGARGRVGIGLGGARGRAGSLEGAALGLLPGRGRAGSLAGAALGLLRGRSAPASRAERVLAVASGLALAAGSLATRFAVFEAGLASAADPAHVVAPQRARKERGEPARADGSWLERASDPGPRT